MRAIAAIPALGLVVGGAVGFLWPTLPLASIEWALVAAAGVVFWAAWLARPRLVAVAAACAFALGGALLMARELADARSSTLRAAFAELAAAERAEAEAKHLFVPVDEEAYAVVVGTLTADAAVLRSGVSLHLDVDEVGQPPRPVSGGVSLMVTGDLALQRVDEWLAGRRIRAPARLRRPARYLDPGVSDSEDALARHGVALVGTVKSGGLVDVVARGGEVAERVAGARVRARRIINVAVGRWSPGSAAIVAAIVLGDRTGLDPELQRHLQEAGTYHVIAISGGNIAILAGLLLAFFRVAGMLGRAAMVAAIVVLVAYADLVGGGASVDRATLMAVAYFAGRALDHRGSAVNALALTAACLVAAAPLTLVDPAFVLTCGATLAILLVSPVAAQVQGPKWARPAWSLLAASVAAEGALLPVGALVFSRVTVAGLGLNFLAIPLMGVAQVAGMAVVPVGLVSTRAAAAVGWVAHLGASGLVFSAGLMEWVPRLSWRVAAPAWPAVVAYYVGLVGWWSVWRLRVERWGSGEPRGCRATRRICAALAVASAAWIVTEPWRVFVVRGDGRLHVTFIDVGQGDATFIRFPHGHTMLVDAGGISTTGTFDVGDRVVAPVLREAGVGRLDTLVVTHGDPDHMGGASAIVREFRPREVWEGVPVPPFEPLQRLRAQTAAARLTWRGVNRGELRSWDGVDVRVLHPPPPDWERQRVRNDDSVVLEVRLGDVSVLLPGDIGVAIEPALADDLAARPLRLVKLPHHGSASSSGQAFVDSVRPQVGIASVGRSNHFGHPAAAVVARYQAVGATLLRTDLDGAIEMITDGQGVRFTTFSGRTLALGSPP